jgi:hypothetical protein
MIAIDKYKAIKKWKPIIESLKVTDERKIELMSIYGEYKQIVVPTPMPAMRNQGIATQNFLPMEMKILSKLNLENKGVIMNSFNDDKIKFVNPHPMLRFTLGYEEIDTDIKLARKNKIKAINAISVNGTGNFNVSNAMLFAHRLDNMAVDLIVSDLNHRLKDGQLLYIDQQIISNLAIINSNPTTMELKVTYDII